MPYVGEINKLYSLVLPARWIQLWLSSWGGDHDILVDVAKRQEKLRCKAFCAGDNLTLWLNK